MTAAPADEGADYFSLLELQPAFELDESALAANFHRLQQQHHPDGGGDALEGMSVRLNEAYRALRSRSGRARCLLSLMGCAVSPDDAAKLSPKLLMQQFELREQLQQADSADRLAQLRRQADRLLSRVGAHFAGAWRNNSVREAQSAYHQLLFTERFVSAIDEREDLLLDEPGI